MLSGSLTVAIITGISTLCGVGFTILGQAFITNRNQRFELEKEQFKFNVETSRNSNDLKREKLEKAHIILSEISREFSLTFLTIDWSARMSPNDFHNKYRNLCAKIAEVNMIAEFYVPSIKESIDDLCGLMNHYWGNFHIVLMKEERGEKVDHTTLSYSEAVGYSQKIPSKVNQIQSKIAKIVDSAL